MKKRLIPLAVLAAAMASCSSDDVIEANPDPSGNALTFSIAVGHSRATPTDITNLGNFKVVAKGVHPYGGLYDSFLIGGESDGELASRNGEISDGTSGSKYGVWTLERNIYWPTAIDNALFWAYSCSQIKGSEKSAVLPEGCTFKFDTSARTLTVSNFSPAKCNLEGALEDNVWADGLDQVDFVTAFKSASRTSNVALQFQHVLSQINIKAQSINKKDNDSRIVKIKGAWLVNTKDQANLTSTYDWVNSSATHNLSWQTLKFKTGNFSAYGSYYNQEKLLNHTNSSTPQDLLENGRSLMLIPQQIKAWNKTAGNKSDAYILLLCRVELEHPGTNHSGNANTDDINIVGDKHYQQHFPVNANKKFDAAEYGFVCVPVGITDDMEDAKKWSFEMGYNYTFNLDICGDLSGAGIYPPEETDVYTALLPTSQITGWGTADSSLKIVNRPSGKNIGDAVLDNPIQFEVTVKPWDENTEWSEGNIVMPK